jgi:transposase-like protein
MDNPFKWRHYESEIIFLCVRWCLRYATSYKDVEEMMTERGLSVVDTTIYGIVKLSQQLQNRGIMA